MVENLIIILFILKKKQLLSTNRIKSDLRKTLRRT